MLVCHAPPPWPRFADWNDVLANPRLVTLDPNEPVLIRW